MVEPYRYPDPPPPKELRFIQITTSRSLCGLTADGRVYVYLNDRGWKPLNMNEAT